MHSPDLIAISDLSALVGKVELVRDINMEPSFFKEELIHKHYKYTGHN